VMVPLLGSDSSTPDVVDPSSGGLDIPTVLPNRPRPTFQRSPAKGHAFQKTRVPSTAWNLDEMRIAPQAHETDTTMTPLPHLRGVSIATGGASAFLFPSRVPGL